MAVSRSKPEDLIAKLGLNARKAAQNLAQRDSADKNRALTAAAAAIESGAARILQANTADLEAASARGISGAMLDRLTLDPARLKGIADGLERIADLPDPVGRELARWQQPNGLDIARVTVPIGVIGVIFEARPNVTADAAALCLKAGNAVILRGGSEAVESNRAIHAAIVSGLETAGLDPGAVQMVPDQDRALVGALLGAHQWIDVIVPRGGQSLVKRVQRDARVPVFAHLDGNNHLYWHGSADPEMAIEVIVNAKMRRPGICGALETLLIDRACLEHLPRLVDALDAKGCEVRGDAFASQRDARIRVASESDWATEYLDAILAVGCVESPNQAIEHIVRYGSGHTDGVLTADANVVESFLNRVDSAIVVHNASTQFADGGEFGFGAEIGIATGRLHARGPVGLEQLTTFKYLVRGSGQTRP